MARTWDKENLYIEGDLKEYGHWVLAVSFRQHTLGSFVVLAKREIEKLTQLTDEEILELKKVLKEVEKTLATIPMFAPDRFNYLQLGNVKHHLHIHGIPRYAGKRFFDGKEWEDTAYGQPPKWSEQEVEKDLVIKIREAIKPFLDNLTAK